MRETYPYLEIPLNLSLGPSPPSNEHQLKALKIQLLLIFSRAFLWYDPQRTEHPA